MTAPTSWLWDFGDGNTSTEQNPTHTYTEAGSYTVSLTATNLGGTVTLTKTNYIVTAAPIVVSWTATGTLGPPPLTTVFTDTTTGDPTSWLWDFGDGNTSTEQNPTHIYTTSGYKTVSLTASNAVDGGSVTVPNYVYVQTAVPKDLIQVDGVPAATSYQYRIGYFNGVHVAAGWTGSPYPFVTYWSDNTGQTWTKTINGFNLEARSFAVGTDRCISVGGNNDATNRSARTTDGKTWTSSQNMPAITFWYGLAFGNGFFRAVSFNSATRMAITSDGISWSSVTTTGLPSSRDCIVFGNNTWVVGSRDTSATYTSTNGADFTASAAQSCNFYTMWFDNGYFFGIPLSGPNLNKMMYSTNGSTWTVMTLPTGNGWWMEPRWTGNFWVASRFEGGVYYFYWSQNLTSWTPFVVPSGIQLASGNAGRCALGNGWLAGLATGNGSAGTNKGYRINGANWE